MKEKIYFRIGIVAIILGLLSCFSYIFAHFYISYFSSLGIKEWFSSFCLSIILTISGFFLTKEKKIGVFLLNSFIYGTYLDRLIAKLIWFEYITITEVINPISTYTD